MNFLRSSVFNIIFYGSIIFFGILFTPLLLSKNVTNWITSIWAKINIFILKCILNVKIEFIDEEKLPSGGALIAANHESAFDTIYFLTKFKNPIYILKQQLLYIPIYGWYVMRLGHIAINRRGNIKTLNIMTKKVLGKIKEGSNIIIFPEGTRTKPNKIGKLKSGIYFIQKKIKFPVYPIIINSGHVWGKNSYVKYSGKIILKVLDPIPFGLERKEFMFKLKDKLNDKNFEYNRKVG